MSAEPARRGTPEEEPARDATGVQALRRALSLLDIVAEAERPLRFTEIAQAAGLSRPTVHRMLGALVEAGLLRVEERDQGYRLGFRLFEMAHRVWDGFDLRSAAEPELERLRELTGETARLAILDAHRVLTVDQRESRQPVRLGNGIGARSAPYASSAGKAILAHLDPLEQRRLLDGLRLERLTPNTIAERKALQAELDLVKARGYAVAAEEQSPGVSSVAAPVLDHRARAIAAVTVVGPSYRLPAERLHALGRDVMEAARRISGNAGQIAMSIQINPRPLGPDRDDVSLAIPSTCFLGEGPSWSAREAKLHWVDILAPALCEGDPATGTYTTRSMPELVSAIVPRARGGFLLAMSSGVKAYDPASGSFAMIAALEPGKPGNRLNDGKCDRRGRFFVGSLAIDTRPGEGSLYRIDPDGRSERIDQGFQVSNGLGWSPDDRFLYFTDSGARTIYRYDYDITTGAAVSRRVFVRLPEGAGTPDGLCVDAEGFVWSAHWDGWCVTRYDPNGAVERVIHLPVPRPTSCVFGGEGLSTLYVTSARIRLSAAQLAEAPLSGAVFAVRTGLRGLPETPFAG